MTGHKTTLCLIDKVQMFLCLVADDKIQREPGGSTHNKIVSVCLGRVKDDVTAVSRGVAMKIS